MAYKNHVISTENEYRTSGFRPPDRPSHDGCDYIAANDAQITPRGVDIIVIVNKHSKPQNVIISYERYIRLKNGGADI